MTPMTKEQITSSKEQSKICSLPLLFALPCYISSSTPLVSFISWVGLIACISDAPILLNCTRPNFAIMPALTVPVRTVLPVHHPITVAIVLLFPNRERAATVPDQPGSILIDAFTVTLLSIESLHFETEPIS